MRSTISASVVCLSVAALAQPVSAQVSDDSRNAETTLEEVLITSQKREERLQDVPISISVLSGDTLDKSSDRGVVEAVSRVPGVFAAVTNSGARTGGSSGIFIRGVSASTSIGSSTTGYYVDSVPFGLARAAFVPDANPYDLERVEVLRGPQGTLYGASALNGVVRILTRNPDLQNYEFKSRAQLSSTDHGGGSYSADAAFNMPLIQDRLAARVVLGYQDLGGWIDKPARNEKDVNDSQTSNVRLKLAAKPSDNFSAGVSAWFSRNDSGAPPFSVDGGRTSIASKAEPSSTDFNTYSLDLGYETSVASIKSATSYIDYQLDAIFELSIPAGGIVVTRFSNAKVFTEELLLTSAGNGPWRWTLGSMYRDAEDHTVSRTTPPVPPSATAWNDSFSESKSVAVFGELTRAFADGRYELTGGLRYFRNKVHDWERSRAGTVTGIPPTGLQSIHNTFQKTTPRAVFNWHPSKDATFYASYSKGFRSGINQEFQIAAERPDIPAADPDTLTNYEIGGKTSLGRFTVESAVYYIDWKDPQQQRLVLISTGNTPAIYNGGSISGPGVDLAVTYSPVDALTLGASYGWNDLAFDADVYTTGSSGGLLQNPKGSRPLNAPETIAAAFVDYSFPLGGSGYRGRGSASVNDISKQITNINTARSPIPGRGVPVMADSITTVRISFAVQAPKHWSATLFVDNATNEEGILPDTYSNTGNPATSTKQNDTVIRPRTYGLQAEYRY